MHVTFRHFVFNYKGFVLFFLQTINICISNIGQLNIFQLFEFYTFIVYLRLLFTSYFDILIASNHEFVQSTKEIQVAPFYIYYLL